MPVTAIATAAPSTTASQEVPYGDTWLITVLGVAPVPAGGRAPTQGQLQRLNAAAANPSNGIGLPPLTD